MMDNKIHYVKKRIEENFTLHSISRKIIGQRIILVLALAVFAIGSITPASLAYASDHQNSLDAITDIEFRTATDFHTYLPGSQLSFNVECNQLAGEFAIGFNTFIQKADGSPADVNDVRNLVFLQRGSSDSGAFIDAVNTGHDRLKLTAEVTCAKLLPVSLPTVPDAPTDLSVVTGDQQATLSWKAPLFDGNSTIIKYQVSAMPDPHTESADDVFAETVDTSFTFDGLINGITYKFQVTAVNDVGPGISSEIITGTPHSTFTPISYPSSYPTPTIYPDPVPITASTPDPTGKTAVCHNDKVTLSLPANAVRAHLKNHDDYLGACLEHTPNNIEILESQLTKQQEKEADKLQRESDKAQREADRLAKQEAKQLQREADKQQREADRLAKQEAKQLQLEADKAQREADRLAKQEAKQLQREAEKAQRQADQIAKLEADKQQREAEKAERESILEAKKAQNNSEKADKESKLPPLGPK